MNMLLIYLIASVKLEKGHKNYLVLVLKLCYHYDILGAHGGVVVKAIRYKPAGRGFDSLWCHWNFSVT